jgi:hypothetical protein
MCSFLLLLKFQDYLVYLVESIHLENVRPHLCAYLLKRQAASMYVGERGSKYCMVTVTITTDVRGFRASVILCLQLFNPKSEF